ncbi:tRNA uridine-5-carboxymethylaminomethyl(34) synthesis enzyme MnmG [Halorhodospira halochloris]|uniref:tRNA uridine-5-carboxymethylaminomethyl(34) synthesis enzyme MnmG n=1 Tax=Halorhodospira halochloris TaxID=1052 RepID=UPI001EE94AAE|nr:tRNA uridine-5-carboxymethylaminomethyl(34) synthesis enzyme MnmG [Halorhodospira halochloris]MCG5547192.1 tRNA uridine-5-carboxymethylaminomethyl(34) synthesis enzyme MnmG [Halorhodospira halochloris]
MRFDLIVVGGGHAGVEAAAAACRLGKETLLITHNLDTIGVLSCNPAIGGIGKGHLVREIAALDGVMGKAADAAAIQGRVLNRRKGPAVQAPRIQADRQTYAKTIREILDTYKNLHLLQDTVLELIIEGEMCVGVKGRISGCIHSEGVVMTTGTFLDGRIHVGNVKHDGGRAGDPSSIALSASLREFNLPIGRLKTGTPPRLDKRSLDTDKLSIQYGEDPRPKFVRFDKRSLQLPEVPCMITYTTPATHEIIENALEMSPMYSGAISSSGPRYCPSIEDKIVRFSDRDSHQIFLEPEGLDSLEVYPNGISTGLPFDVQLAIIRSCPGMQAARIVRPGYAIEYDFVDPRCLRKTLETEMIKRLFLAGQINGTTGYEEAAGQGLIAGVNAALAISGCESWVPDRDTAYIGVMIDDLVTDGVTEPYRMFTSRAEHRLKLRSDNAELRLTRRGYELGLVSEQLWDAYRKYESELDSRRRWLKETRIYPNRLDERQKKKLGAGLKRDMTLYELLKRPDIDYANLLCVMGSEADGEVDRVGEQLKIEALYEGYVEREEHDNKRHKKYADVLIPIELDFDSIDGLSNEVKEKLRRLRPATIGEASAISGVTPAAISILLIHMKSKGWLRHNKGNVDAS